MPPYSADQVYIAENLKFATKDPGRKPTLYFRTNHGSGRLRQEHERGPKIQEIRMHTSHAFFNTKEQQARFGLQFKASLKTRGVFRQIRANCGGHNRPFAGAYHYEATFDGHGPESQSLFTHPSSGTIMSDEDLELLKPLVAGIYAGMKEAV